MLTPLTPIKAQPVQGGCVTVRNAAQLPFGSYSMVQNVRGKHPNFIKRPGQRKLHTSADGVNEVLSLYQFRKSRVDEKHLFAQMSDGDILEATNDPPTITTGAFGNEAFDGGINQIPASWSNVGDKMLMANGVDQHKIYCGDSSFVEKFIVYRNIEDEVGLPSGGEDFTKEISNVRDDVAILDALKGFVDGDCIYIRTPSPISGFYIEVDAPNTNATVMSIHYWRGEWNFLSWLTDGTFSAGASLAHSGYVSIDTEKETQSDIYSKYQLGSCGYWYQMRFSQPLSATVRLKKVTFQSEFRSIANVWDGVSVYAVECQVESAENQTWELYGSGAVEIGDLPSGSKLMVASADPVEGIYFNIGGTPNIGSSLAAIKYWNGEAFVSVGEVVNGTDQTPMQNSVLSNSGWMTFGRKSAAQPTQFQSADFHAYWYEVTFSGQLSSDIVVEIRTMPYFDITELGISQCNTVWKDRAVYTFDKYGSYLYITSQGKPLVLNGTEYGILRAGDGRNNKVVAMRSYKDWLMVWQQEKGVEGGCVTIFSGYNPASYQRTVLSTRIGTMNSKSVAVVEGVKTATADKATALEEKIATLVFFLSNNGVCVSNGHTISIISDDIQNYFDASKEECIRRGYEDKMWLTYDSAYGVLRIGLVSGSLATKANIFPVYDLADGTWSFDVSGQKFACLTEIEAGSGNIPTLQISGGQEDGTIYQSNYGLNDVDKAISTYAQLELNYNGEVINLREFLIRFGAMDYGEVLLEFLRNNVHEMYKTVSMLPENPGQIIKRKRFGLNITDQNISIKISCGEYNTEMNLIEIGMLTSVWSGR